MVHMPAQDALQPEQLRMFMSPREVLGQYKVNYHERRSAAGSPRKETDDEFWQRKTAESKNPMGVNTNERGTSLYNSIRKRGVEAPIHLAGGPGDVWTAGGGKMLGNGTHRIAAQAAHDPDRLMPVVHHETLPQAVWAGKQAEADRSVEQRKATLAPQHMDFLKAVFK